MATPPWAVIEEVPVGQALDRWREWRTRYAETGRWPVIVTDAETLAGIEDRWEATREDFEEAFPGERASVPSEPPGLASDIAPKILAAILQEGNGCWIAALPCEEPVEVPARLVEYGDLCPSPDEHLTTLKGWAERFGAEPLIVGGDRLTLLVKPLESLGEARQVAREQMRYTDGSVEGADEIAPHLVGLPVWSFWFD